MNKANTTNDLGSAVNDNSDTIKGLLILVVVADHNDWFRAWAPDIFLPLTFHVLGFFFLSFSFASKPLERAFVLDRVARYLVPFWLALFSCALAFKIIFTKNLTLVEFLSATSIAAVIGNAPYVKSASGLLMLWFLPCLFGLTMIRSINDRLWSDKTKWVLIAFWILAHATITLAPHSLLFTAPFGLAIVLNTFALCLAWRSVLNWRLPKYWGLSAAILFIASSTYLILNRVHIEIATLDIPTVETPLNLVIHDLSALSGMTTVVWFAGILKRTRLLAAIGKQSLLVYLIHPVIYQVIGRFFALPSVSDVSPVATFANGWITTLLVVLFSYLLAVAISRTPIFSSLVVPRYWGQWLPIRLIGTVGRQA